LIEIVRQSSTSAIAALAQGVLFCVKLEESLTAMHGAGRGDRTSSPRRLRIIAGKLEAFTLHGVDGKAMDADAHAASNLNPGKPETAPQEPAAFSSQPDPDSKAPTLPAKRRRVPLLKPFKHAITQAANVLRKDFLISSRLQADRAGRVLARALFPTARPGRPRRSDVTKALRLEEEGESRKEIYRLLGKNTQAKQHSLREAMRQRRRRDRRRASRDKFTPPVTPTNPD
jgi:hypothetical protein